MHTRRPRCWIWSAISLLAMLACAAPSLAQGIVLPSIGPINRSMGGAATAAPLDAIGAIHWNPATMSGLDQSRMDFGVELLYPQSKLSSSIPASAIAPGLPGTDLSNSDRSDGGAFPLPSFGWVYRPECSPWTYGFGVYTIGGFGVNYPGSTSNPILTAPPPAGLGVGPIYSQLQVLQMAPAVSVQVTDSIAIGLAPTITMASLSVDPSFFAPPDNASGNGFPTYPDSTHGRITWGAGFEVGIYLTPCEYWAFGASFTSPQWFEDFRYQSADQVGNPRTVKLRFDYPLIVSVGAAYSGFENLLLAADVRYIDYHDTAGFGPAGFAATGAATGLGWDSVMFVALGAQYHVSDRLSVRGGYTYNTNPIPDAVASFNVESSPMYQHAVYLGASYRLTSSCALSLSYLHAFHNSISGPIITATGAIPGSSVTEDLSIDAVALGLTVRF